MVHPLPRVWFELTCLSVQLSFSPKGIWQVMAGPQSCVCSSQGHPNDLPERLKSEPHTSYWVYVVNVQCLGQYISHQDGGTLDFSHSLLYSPLPFKWQHSTAIPTLSPAGCFSPWEPGWPWEPLFTGSVWMTRCTPTGWVMAVLHVGKWMSTRHVRKAIGWSRRCPGAWASLLEFQIPHL